MLEQLPQQKQDEVAMISRILYGDGGYTSWEERDRALDILINNVTDTVMSILLREHKE